MMNTENEMATEIMNMLLSFLENTDFLSEMQLDDNKTIVDIRKEIKHLAAKKCCDILDQVALAVVGFVEATAPEITNEHFATFGEEFKQRLIDIHKDFAETKKSEEED